MRRRFSAAQVKKKQILQQLGVSGLQQYGGYVYADPEPELRGVSGARIFDRMARSDPVIAGGIYIINSMINQVPWFVRPGGSRGADLTAAEHMKSCIYDMSVSWNQTVMDIAKMFVFGWSYLERIYKIRRGRYESNPSFRSQYNDGSIGWRRWAPRSQLSLDRWQFNDEDGSLEGMIQRDPNNGTEYFIPLKKALLFRFGGANDNPEGESPIRPCWGSWVNQQTIEEIMTIGLERDLAGHPVGRAPKNVMEKKTDNDETAYNNMMNMLTNIRNDEAAGTLLSSERDPKGNYLWDLELLAAAGPKQFNLVQIISYYDQKKAGAFLVDILLLGSGRQGSYALAETKGRLLNAAISSVLDNVCETINQHAISDLAELNPEIYDGLDQLPELAHGKVEMPNLEQLTTALQRLGYHPMWADPDAILENHLRELADLPTNKATTTEGDAVQKEGMEKALIISDLARRVGGRLEARRAAV